MGKATNHIITVLTNKKVRKSGQSLLVHLEEVPDLAYISSLSSPIKRFLSSFFIGLLLIRLHD